MGTSAIPLLNYHSRLWPDQVYCDTDELGRVMHYVVGKDTAPFDGRNPAVPGWETVPDNEVNSAQTIPLRFRVMLKRPDETTGRKGIAFVGFRCTDWKLDDIKLDAYLALSTGLGRDYIDRLPGFRESLSRVKVRDIVRNIDIGCFTPLLKIIEICIIGDLTLLDLWNNLQRVCNELDQTRVMKEIFKAVFNPLHGVEEAHAYVERTVLTWARQKGYTVVVGGYSLGGFFARYVGLTCNLPNISFDGLYGAHKFVAEHIRQEHVLQERSAKCVNLVYHRHNIVNCSNASIGSTYQACPHPDTVREFSREDLFGWIGHKMAYFYDYQDTDDYITIGQEIGDIYGTNDRRDLRMLSALHNAMKCFRVNNRERGLQFFSAVPSSIAYDVHAVMHRIMMRYNYPDVWERGRVPFTSSDRYAVTNEDRAKAIESVLLARWNRA